MIRRFFPTLAAIALFAGTTGCGDVVVEPGPDPASKSGDPFQPPDPNNLPAPEICGDTHLGIHGTIGDEPYNVSAGSVGASFSKRGYLGSLGSGAVLAVGDDSFAPGTAESAPKTAWLAIPHFLPKAGLVLCDDAAPKMMTAPMSADSLIVLSSLRELGTCPGTPVSGELTAGPKGIDGQLDGVPFSATVLAGFGLDGEGGREMEGGGALLLWPTEDGGTQGILLTSPTSEDAGTFYCIGATDIEASHLSKISRLGTCAEGTPIGGELRVCTGKVPSP